MSDLSRVEQLLRNALGEDIYEVTPQSRVEALLVELNELIEGMDGSVSPEDIATAVAAYLDEHLTNPTNPPVDTSLSISGAAADAKKTGDELSDLKEGLNAKASTVNGIAPDAEGNVEIETSGSGTVTETVTGESVTFVTSDTSLSALSIDLEYTVPDTSSATPSNPVSITGIASETITVNGTDKVVTLANPIGKGTWDVLTGEVVDERPVVDLTGDMVINKGDISDTVGWIKISKNGSVPFDTIVACSHYPIRATSTAPGIREHNGIWYLYDTALHGLTIDEAREYIAGLNAKLVLDPVTPVELSETPETITLVNGENTVAVSTGEMLLTYAVDVKGYVDGKVASVENTANEALETANGLDARVTANTELSESNEQKVYKFRTETESNTGTGSASTANTTRWGFHLDIDESIEKCYSITFTPQFPSTVTGEYTATRWKKESGTLATGDILTKVDEVTRAVGESVTFEALGVNEFISLNKSCQRTTDVNGNVRLGYVNETTGAYTSFSGFLSGSFEVTFCKSVKDDSMPLYGTKIALVGDSITEYNGRASTNHAMYLKQWTGAIVQNLGVGGTGFSTNNKYKDRITNIKADTEIIGVAASLNDMRNTVGTASDTASDETVCGYVNEFFDLLLSSFPSTPIVCYSEGPWNTYRPGVAKSDSYMEQMAQICLNKGIAWDDGLYRGCALRPWIQANREALYKGEWGDYTDVVDDIHPNSAGQRYIAIYLKSLFEKYARD